MKKYICFIVFLLFLQTIYPLSWQFCFSEDKPPLPETDYVPHEVLIKFLPGTAESEKASVREALGAQKVKVLKSINVEYWKLPEDVTTEEALDYLKESAIVEYAEPNYLKKLQVVPNDQYFNQLWYLHNYGQSVNGTIGISGADISAPEAWNIETGNRSVIIAVIDSGVAYEHPDLINNVWTNRGEIPGNGIDDDHNGYVDDVHGWDFVSDDNNPSDYNGHGTMVAGIIAAQGNNVLGTSGVMWISEIMCLKACSYGQISLVAELSAIRYAVNNGAKIINCSFASRDFSQAEYDVIYYANRHGVLVVCAAGNETSNNDYNPTYPASYNLPNIISVAATNELDVMSSYSNYGPQSVDIAAPGGNGSVENICSITPPEYEVLFFDNFENDTNKWLTSGNYEKWSIGYDRVFDSYVLRDSVNNYHDNEFSRAWVRNPIDTTHCRGLILGYQFTCELEPNRDFYYLDISLNGSDWAHVIRFTGFYNDKVYFFPLALTEDEELPQLYMGFSLISDYSINYSGVKIDNVIVIGRPWYFTGSEHGYASGTSFSAPIVAAVAGLLWSHNPNLTYLQVKSIILDSVDRLPSLAGWVLSGGRVNAYKALLSSDGWIDIDGSVSSNGLPICAMVLANGHYMFTPSIDGWYNLHVPLDSNGQITLFAFADGFAPYKRTLSPYEITNFRVEMTPAHPDTPGMSLTVDLGAAPSHTDWVRIFGNVRTESGVPICAMILANGQYMFSNSTNGSFDMEVPLDEHNQVTIFAFADGFRPYKETITY